MIKDNWSKCLTTFFEQQISIINAHCLPYVNNYNQKYIVIKWLQANTIRFAQNDQLNKNGHFERRI